jgi:mycothiol synthase
MNLKSRPYTGLQDFIVMTSILAVGRKTTRRPYYVHPGDLSWWLFYADHDDAHWGTHVWVWEQDGQAVGWSLIDPDWYSFDVYLLPEMRGTPEEARVLDWTIERLSEAVHQNGGDRIRTVWVSEHDEDRIGQLHQRGFDQDEKYMWYLERALNAQIPEIMAPSDFRVRSIRGAEEIYQRAAASYDAFGSTRQFEEYWPRYERFMQSPVYNSNYDLVTEAPDGEFASFCIVWPDPVNRVGLLEPVGTHTNFQKMGLGRTVVTAGLRQLQAWGMNRAMVCAEHDNLAAIQLYRAVGFEKKHKLLTFVKDL